MTWRNIHAGRWPTQVETDHTQTALVRELWREANAMGCLDVTLYHYEIRVEMKP